MSSHEVDLDALFSLPPKIGQVIVTVLGEFPSNDTKFNEFQFRKRIKPYVPLSLICYVLIATIGFILNLNLIRFIVRIQSNLSYSHRHLYTLLLGNSVNDMLIKDVIVLPISYVILTSVHWTLGQSFCRLFPLLQDSCFHVTSLTFLFAFYTRYKHISNAHFNSATNDVRHVKNETAVISAIHPAIILIICWVISICGVIPHTVFITYIDLGHYLGPLFDGSGVCVVNIEDNIAEYIRFLFALFYLIPIVMTISYHFKCVDIISRWNKSSEEYRGRGVAIVHRGSIVENVSYTHGTTSTTMTATSSSSGSDRNHNVRSSICSINNPNQVPKTKLLLSNEPIDEGDEDGIEDDELLVIRNLNARSRSSTVHVPPNELLATIDRFKESSQSSIQRSQSVRVPRTTFSNQVDSHVYQTSQVVVGRGKRNSLQPTMLNDHTSIGQQQLQHQTQVHSSNLQTHRPSISRQLPSLNHLGQHLSPSSPTAMTVGHNTRAGSVVSTTSDGAFLTAGNPRTSRASSMCVVRNTHHNDPNDAGNFLDPKSSSPAPSSILISPSPSSFVNGRNDYYHQHHHHPAPSGAVVPPNVQSYQRTRSPRGVRIREGVEGDGDVVEGYNREDGEEMYEREEGEEQVGYQSFPSPSSSAAIPAAAGGGNSRTRPASQSTTGNAAFATRSSFRGNPSQRNTSIASSEPRSSITSNTFVGPRGTMTQIGRTGSVTSNNKYSSASVENRRKISNTSSTTPSAARGESSSSRIDTITESSSTTRRKSSGFDEFIDPEDGDKMSNLSLEESLQRMLLTIFLIYSVLLLPLNVLRFTKNLLPEPPGMAIVFDLIFIVSIGFQFMTTLVIPLVIQRTSQKLFNPIGSDVDDPLSHLRSQSSSTTANYGSSIMITSNNRFAKNYGQQSSAGHLLQQQQQHNYNLSANHGSMIVQGTSPSPSTSSFRQT